MSNNINQDKKSIRIDIGCSKHKISGYIGIDILKGDLVDVVCDARRLPFGDDIVDEVYSRYALEHIPDNLAVISELYRVCKNDAMIKLILPHFSNPSWYDDLTHRYKYSTRSFEHFDNNMRIITGYPDYLPYVNLQIESAKLGWWPMQIIERKSWLKRSVLGLINKLISSLANAHPFFCERIWCNWVGGFYEVTFILRVKKTLRPCCRV